MQVVNTQKQNRAEKSVFKAIFLILAWVLIVSLAKDVLHIQKGFGRVEETELRLAKEQARNSELVAKLKAVQEDEYREKLIREQLNMQKEGEVVAVLPKKGENRLVPSEAKGEEIANWKKWLNLIY